MNKKLTYNELLAENEELVEQISNNKIRIRDHIDGEKRFKALSDATFEALFILDRGFCIETNDAGCKLFKYSYCEMIGMFVSDVIAEESKELVLHNVKTDYQEPYEAVILKKDGSKQTVEIQGKTIFYNNKKHRVTAIRDISYRKRMELKLKDSENKFRTIIENAGDGILIGNSKGEIIEINASFCVMTGFLKEELVKQHISMLFSEETLKESPLRFDLLDIGKSIIIKREIVGKSGSSILIEMNSKRLNEDYYISVIRDLSERIKVENELRKTNKSLRHAIKKAKESELLKSEFLANMSHEIRTPMNGIMGFAELLNEPNLKEEQTKYFTNIIINSSNQLKQIIDDILEISVLETKQVKVIQDEVCLNSVIIEIFSVFDNKAKDNGTPLYINNGLNEKHSTVYTDDVKLRKILNNLIDNALHYTFEGSIEVGYVIVENNVEFFVKDTGIGISLDSQRLIFERFSQGDKSLSRKFGGLGLGLSIAKENTELLGGKIWVESKKGQGSVFKFTIPYNSVFDIESVDNFNKDCVDGDKKDNKYTILIAEDEEANYLYYQTVIDKANIDCNIIHAKNGREAVDFCKQNSNINLVLMDIKMPVMNGLDATKEIKSFAPEMKIIAQTAYTTVDDIEKSIAVGCCDFISKPIKRDALEAILTRYLNVSETR